MCKCHKYSSRNTQYICYKNKSIAIWSMFGWLPDMLDRMLLGAEQWCEAATEQSKLTTSLCLQHPTYMNITWSSYSAASIHPEEDHHRVIAAALRSPSDWRRPAGRPRTTWLRTTGGDLQSQNFGVHTAWRKAKERDTWHQVVSTATLC